jgi:hypothetical protein
MMFLKIQAGAHPNMPGNRQHLPERFCLIGSLKPQRAAWMAR